MTLKCEVCGQRVSVYTSRGGTSSYVPEAEKIIESLTAALAKIAISVSTYFAAYDMAANALKEIESLPEENCGTCKHNDNQCSCNRENCCHTNDGLVLITEKDFCSRWVAR